MLDFFRDRLLARGMINQEDLELFKVLDDEDEILELIKTAPVQIGVRYKGSFTNV
jgi:predicted Rossmann-fold nucleotide-binding protein